MESDDSSLTWLSETEDEAPVTKGRKRTKKEWQPKQVLKAPRLTQYSTHTLYEEILNGKVDLDPEYQRDVVWTDTKQSGLIDSLLRNFYIPPIIFAFSQTEDGEEKRTCIDGKQRLTSIQRFMDGQIPFKDSQSNQKMWYKLQPGNESGRLLPDQYRKQFSRKQISCVEYSDINEDAERDIFQRVQLGVALTPAERMQAISGPWTQLVRDILTVLEEYKISDSLEWSKKRGRDFQAVVSIVYFMEKSGAGFPPSSTLEKWLQRKTPPNKTFKDRVMEVFKVFRQLVLTKKHSRVFQKPTRVAPIEFVMCVILVDAHFCNHTLTQLADGIRRMRRDVRSKHIDIRSNGKVLKTMMAFIHDNWPSDLKKSESDEKKALAECEANPVHPPVEMGKRKRVDSDTDDSFDDSARSKHNEKKIKPVSAATTRPSPAKKSPPTSRMPIATSSTNPETRNVRNGGAPTPSRPSANHDRLAPLHKAKGAVSAQAQSHTSTPPPASSSSSARQTPVLQARTAYDPTPQQNVVNQPNHSSPFPNASMWPHQPNSQIAVSNVLMPPSQGSGPAEQSLQQISRQMPQSNANPLRQGQGQGIGTADPRLNPNRSNPPTPTLNGTVPTGSAGRGLQPSAGGYRDSVGYRSDSPRQPQWDPRGRGQESPAMRGRPSYPPAPYERQRDVLSNVSGGLGARDRDRRYSHDYSRR